MTLFKKIIAANWKMFGSQSSIEALLTTILTTLPLPLHAECIIFPPAIYLPLVQQYLKDSPLKWGAQNVFSKQNGAYTGEISCSMLKDFGCLYVLIGHSERRIYFAENESLIQEKFYQVKEQGMIPILCIGESEEARQAGQTAQILTQQLTPILQTNPNAFENAIIAYEPIWAIGTGITASVSEVAEAHHFIRKILSKFNKTLAETTPILYGGSLNETSAKNLFEIPDVNGGLIGSASLDARKFVEIIKCIN